MDDRLCDEKMKNIDEKVEREEKRIEKLEENSMKLTELSVQLTEIIKSHACCLSDHEERLDSLEKRPGMWFDKVIAAGISALIAALVSALF
ncbi:MAG: hypothetical protein Q8882_06040 [Bacillota bacterium]|nr:hypothetical protein [Bacillota bacterium]